MNEQILNTLAETLQTRYGLVSTTVLDKAIADLLKKTERRESRKTGFSLATLIRGMKAERGEIVNRATAEADVAFVKALATGTTPGSYIVPTIQSEEFIEYLTLGGVARAMGSRIWDLTGIQKLNVVSALATPTFVWTGQNSAQTATDPNLGQISFNLNERRAIVAVPNQLLAVSVPAFDTLLASLLGAGAAEHEDTAFFGSTNASGGPTCLMQASGISTLLVGSSANGGNLTFGDLTATLYTASKNKAKGPFCWVASPRTFWQRIYGMIDLNSRPLFIPTLTQGLTQSAGVTVGQAPVGNLLGYPVYVTPAIAENEANGSGTNQSHLIFTNPGYCHIAQNGAIEIAISLERYFEANQTAVRCVHQLDLAFAPAAGITVLLGVN